MNEPTDALHSNPNNTRRSRDTVIKETSNVVDGVEIETPSCSSTTTTHHHSMPFAAAPFPFRSDNLGQYSLIMKSNSGSKILKRPIRRKSYHRHGKKSMAEAFSFSNPGDDDDPRHPSPDDDSNNVPMNISNNNSVHDDAINSRIEDKVVGHDDKDNNDDGDDDAHNDNDDDADGDPSKPPITTNRQSTISRKRRSPTKTLMPLQCSTRNGMKPRRSKRAKSTTLDTSKPKTAHITKNKDNNHDLKKGKKRQRSRSRRSWPISKFYSSDDDDDDHDDNHDDNHDEEDDDRYQGFQPSQICIGEHGEVMCRVPCQFCASRFKHYPSLVSVGLSKVHRYGVFANQDIEEDTFLLQFVAREVPSHPTEFTLQSDGRIFDWEGITGVHKYINHNCETGPFKTNARFHMWRNQHDQEIISIISNRDIEMDEEIFIHFGKDFLWPEPCRCPNCSHLYDDTLYTKPQRRHSW